MHSTSKNLNKFVSGKGKAMAFSVSFWLRYFYLAKMIAYYFIQNCFKCDYNHYSTGAFGNTRITFDLCAALVN